VRYFEMRAVRAGMLAVIMPRHCSARPSRETGTTFQETSSESKSLGKNASRRIAVIHVL